MSLFDEKEIDELYADFDKLVSYAAHNYFSGNRTRPEKIVLIEIDDPDSHLWN